MDRLNSIGFHISSPNESLTITSNRSGHKSVIPIVNDCIKASDLAKAAKGDKEEKFFIYDPGFSHTAVSKSAITFIDGNKGILNYRGYKIEELAEKATFLEVAFLLLYGELPSETEFKYFSDRVMKHTFIHSDLAKMMKSFRFNSHPMGILISAFAAMSTLHPEANPALAGQKVYEDRALRNKQIHRIIGTMPTVAAFSYRQRQGRPFVYPSHQTLGYAENFLYMLDRVSNPNYAPHPGLAKALDILFILHADHELNCSTAAMRHLSSSGVDVYSAIAGSTAALYGPRHGGANQAVIQMLKKIEKAENIPAFLQGVKDKKEKLMGFGHRVYKSYDPRARIVQRVAKTVFDIVGEEPLIKIALALEKQALSDEYFVSRKLYPNIDFYSGIIYRAMGFPDDFFPVLFAIPRTVGWLAHWNEFLDDSENKIARPRQVYVGHEERSYVPIAERKSTQKMESLESNVSIESKRRVCADVTP